MTEEVQVGKTYAGKVLPKRIRCFCGNNSHDGLVHISELSDGYIEKVEDVVKVGQEIMIKAMELMIRKGLS